MARTVKTKEERAKLDARFKGASFIKIDRNRKKLPSAAQLKKLREAAKKRRQKASLKLKSRTTLKRGTRASIRARLLKKRPKKNFTVKRKRRTLKRVGGKVIIK